MNKFTELSNEIVKLKTRVVIWQSIAVALGGMLGMVSTVLWIML